MDFQLTDEHRMVQATVREFARQEILPRAAALDHTPVFPSEIIQKAAALGLMGMVIPEAYGGAGMDPVSYVVAQDDPIFHFGTEDQKRRYLPRLSSGASLGCYCLTEPAYGSDAMSLRTDARREADQWILRGTKAFVTNAVEADVCIVYARTGPEPGARGISAFIVEKGFPGISVGKVEKKLGIKCSSTAEIVLDGCRVPASNLLGEPGSGGKIALTTLDGGRLGIAAQAVGIARAALEEATAYAAGRRQFGRSIGEFQAIQWMLADMATRTDAARLLMLRAAYLRQQ
ncbi:MAG: acyl-CoA dehydrogenase, partial [Armatimonadetes bacterium 13_1_40CM_3_65_7]